VHGHSLGVYDASDGFKIDVRVFRHKWDARFDVGHPMLFAEHAVYRSLDDRWRSSADAARGRIRLVLIGPVGLKDQTIRWMGHPGVLVDYVSQKQWRAFQAKRDCAIRNYTFKLALVLYSRRVLELEGDFPVQVRQMRQRLWSAQRRDGGIAHFVDVRADGESTPADDSTGEACAIAILSETVRLLETREWRPLLSFPGRSGGVSYRRTTRRSIPLAG